jgi:hypothetical protein
MKDFVYGTDAMVDLETLGLKPGCVVLSIGAVIMQPTGWSDQFYRNLEPEAQKAMGLVADQATVEWWSKQKYVAQEALLRDRQEPLVALQEFRIWCQRNRVLRVWGNGANFDNPILRAMYDAFSVKPGWEWYNDRCYRTLKNLRPSIPFERQGVLHNALDDARSQADHAVKILNAIDGWENVPCPSPWKVRLNAVRSAVFRKNF